MEMDHDAGVCSDTFLRLVVGVGRTSGALKEVGHARMRGDFCRLHHVLDVTQGRALCRGQIRERRDP